MMSLEEKLSKQESEMEKSSQEPPKIEDISPSPERPLLSKVQSKFDPTICVVNEKGL